VQLVLGSSKMVPELADELTTGHAIKGVSIEAYHPGDKTAFDRFDFDTVFVTGVQTAGADAATTNGVSFVYAKVDESYRDQKADGSLSSAVQTGWDFQKNAPGSAGGAPGAAQADKLAEQLAVDTHLEYYVRFDGVSGSGGAQWLKLEDFSMGLHNSTTISRETGGAGGGRATADEVLLQLGSSSALEKLEEDLFKGTVLKNFEVEVYRAGGGDKAQLVDEFWFENALVTGVDRASSSATELGLTVSKFSHDHIEQKADGSAGAHTMAGWDFTKNVEWTHGTAHADIDFTS